MTLTEALVIVQAISIVIGVIVACGTLLSRQNRKISDLTEMKVDIKYIKEKMDKIDPMTITLAEVEQSVKQAHKRIDEHIANHK